MRRLYLAAGGLGLSVLVSIAAANAPVAQETESSGPETVAFDPFGAPAAEPAVEPAKAADPEAVLREEYLKLMQEKAALMDKAALEAALSEAQQDIQELAADGLLGEAKTILARVIEEYPNTVAAREAAFLMQRTNGAAPQPGDFRPL
jgi:hypothetical protein